MAKDREIHEEVKALDIGSQVRQLRQRNGLTLQNVSDLTGLSKPLLSQIENNIAAPPIATLLKISKALGVNIGYFFQDAPSDHRIAVVRRDERKKAMRRSHQEADNVGYMYESLAYTMIHTYTPHCRLPGVGYMYESLAYTMIEKHMEPFLVEIEPRSEKDLIFYNHRGEEFLYVLEGEVEFRCTDRIISLGHGNSIYFDSSLPHALRALNRKSGKALAVVFSQ